MVRGQIGGGAKPIEQINLKFLRRTKHFLDSQGGGVSLGDAMKKSRWLLVGAGRRR